MKKTYLSKKGFTLIELLVVIAIIGILRAIVIASLNGARANSRDGKRLSDLAQLQLALESYFDACKQYPPVGSANPYYLDDAVSGTTGNGCPTGVNLNTFLPAVPRPSMSTMPYVYEPQNSNKSYCLGAKFENPANSSRVDQCAFSNVTGYNNAGTPATDFSVAQGSAAATTAGLHRVKP